MQPKLISLALFGAFTLPCAAFADTTTLDEVVVTATRTPQSLNKTLSDTTVLNEQAIRQSGAPDVATLLRAVAGVEVAQSGGLGANSSTFMRGTNSSHVLVLLDGVRISSATTGTTALEHLMLDNIARIEVVRGNVSSLYGSEAIGGVIQLFTKQGSGAPAFNASAGFGSHGTQKIAAGFSGAANDTTFSLNVGNVKTNGVSAINPRLAPAANPNNDGYNNTTISGQVQHAFNADHALSATVFSTRGNKQYDSSFGLPTDTNNLLTTLDKFSVASDNQFTQAWHSQLRLAQGTDSNHAYLNGAPSFFFQTRSNQLTWQNDVALIESQKVSFAVEQLAQQLASNTKYTQSKRTVNSLLGGYVGEFGAHQVQLNVRQDRYSDMGNVNTGLLGYGWQFADAWRATASVSNGFKAPTFADMYYPLSFGYAGNPNLRPERADNREVGVHYAAGGQSFKAVYFDQRIRDLIVINNTFTSVTNLNQARIDGVELQYAGTFDHSRLTANLTLQNPRDGATGARLLRRSKELATIGIMQDLGAWKVGGELRHSGSRSDADIATFAPVILPSYQLVNLTANYQLAPQLSLNGRIDNLFNKDYMQVHGYNTLGRTVFVGLSYQP
ncbi:MAG: TonB-dependent receptor [Gallionella sp.]|nr:TonB-dependent receptor [Gallionella sp.]MDD4959625.1 TonB-dependent receptor [Gallionella sp.]